MTPARARRAPAVSAPDAAEARTYRSVGARGAGRSMSLAGRPRSPGRVRSAAIDPRRCCRSQPAALAHRRADRRRGAWSGRSPSSRPRPRPAARAFRDWWSEAGRPDRRSRPRVVDRRGGSSAEDALAWSAVATRRSPTLPSRNDRPAPTARSQRRRPRACARCRAGSSGSTARPRGAGGASPGCPTSPWRCRRIATDDGALGRSATR